MEFDLVGHEIRGQGRPGFEPVAPVLSQPAEEIRVACNLAPLNSWETADGFRVRFFLQGTPR